MDDTWLQSLRLFIGITLQRIKNAKTALEREKYLTPEAMVIWARAFTHETVSPSDNYEDLEFLGDAILKAVFPKFLMKRLPWLHKGEYTGLNTFYMAKVYQGDLARKLGFNNYIRVKGIERANSNVDTDVFESFFGALDEVSDLVMPGLGFTNCYDMIVSVFDGVKIDENKGRGSAKTQVIQMFVRFGLPKPEEQTPGTDIKVIVGNDLSKMFVSHDRLIGHAIAPNDKDAECEAYKQAITVLKDNGLIEIQEQKVSKHGEYESVNFTVKLRPAHIEFLKKYGVKITNPNIGSANASDKARAMSEAYEKALNFLENLGVTTEWAEEEKRRLDFAAEDIQRFVPAAERRLKTEGFKEMYFFAPGKTTTSKGAIVQLVGIKPDDKHEVLKVIFATDKESGYRLSKIKLVQEYGSGM